MKVVNWMRLVMTVCVALSPPPISSGELMHKLNAQQPWRLERLTKRPDLGIDYARVARFKLGTRKTTYRIGEMISIDLAVLCESNTPIFFHKLKRPGLEIVAKDERGVRVSVNDYSTVLEGSSPDSYDEIKPGHIMGSSFLLLAGCTGGLKEFLEKREKVDNETTGLGEAVYFRRLFEASLFGNWGEACLDIKIPGTYSITAEFSNDTVLVPHTRSKTKTAVGTIRTPPLTLTITE